MFKVRMAATSQPHVKANLFLSMIFIFLWFTHKRRTGLQRINPISLRCFACGDFTAVNNLREINFEKIAFGSLLEHAWDLLIDFRKVLGGSGRVLGWF